MRRDARAGTLGHDRETSAPPLVLPRGSGCRRTARSCCGDRRPGCWAWTRAPRSPSTTSRRRWRRCSTSWPARSERVGLVARAVQRGADRDAAEELLRRLVDGRRAGRRGRAATGSPGSARRPPSSWCGGGPLAVGIAPGSRSPASAACGSMRTPTARCRRATWAPASLDADRGRPAVDAIADVRPAGSRRARAPGRHRRGPCPTCACSPTPSSPNRHGSRHCTATGSRTCPCGCATAPGSSGRWSCRAGRPASAAWSCTGAPATPAGRPSRPSSSGDPAAAVPPRRRPPRRWGPPRCSRRWTSRAAAGRPAPPVLGATLELDLASGELLRRPWPAHPDCGCGARTVRADMRAARRTGDNHEVMSAARPLK